MWPITSMDSKYNGNTQRKLYFYMFIQCLDQVMIHKKKPKTTFYSNLHLRFLQSLHSTKYHLYSVFFVLTNYYLFKVQDRCVLLSALEINRWGRSSAKYFCCLESMQKKYIFWTFLLYLSILFLFSILEFFRWASGKREFDTFRNSVVIELLSILFYNMKIEVFKKSVFVTHSSWSYSYFIRSNKLFVCPAAGGPLQNCVFWSDAHAIMKQL